MLNNLGAKVFPFSKSPILALGPPISISSGYPSYLPEVKRPGRDFYHSTPHRAKVKNECRYTSNPPIYLHDVGGHNCTFYPTYIMGTPIMRPLHMQRTIHICKVQPTSGHKGHKKE